MFDLTKEFRFEAAHVLPDHDGKCARLHGHSWRGEVTLRGPVLFAEGPMRGMLLDFGKLKKYVEPLVDTYLDHNYLNLSIPLEHPTSEAIAEWLFHAIEAELPHDLKPLLYEVRISETCTSAAAYRRA